MNPTPLDNSLIKQFSTLYHVTRFDNALKILESRTIYGADQHRHANFGVDPRPELAKTYHQSEVILQFHWPGTHMEMYSSGDFLPSTGAKPNVMYHVRSGDSIINNYWQSNLFPGSKGIKLTAIKLIGQPATSKSFFHRLLSKASMQEHAKYKYEQAHLSKLNSYIGVDLRVPR